MKIHQTKPFHNCTITIILNGNVSSTQRRIQRDLEVGIPVWAPKLGAQKSFLVHYISSSIHGDKLFVNTQGLHWLKKRTIVH